MLIAIKKHLAVFFSFSFMFFQSTAYSVELNNQTLQQNTYSFLQVSGTDGWTFKGVNAANMIYLPIMPQWNVETIQLHLIFERALASGNATNLNLYINDVPLSSLELKGDSTQPVVWDVVIPKDRIKNQFINLKITNNLRESGYDCTKITNPGFWVTMLGSSTVTYQFHLNPYTPNLKNFPYPFVNKQGLEKDAVTLLVANEKNKEIQLALFNVSNVLGKYKTWRGLNLDVQPIAGGTKPLNKNANTIMIGTAKNLKLTTLQLKLPLVINQDQLLYKDGTALATNEGVVIITESPDDSRKALMIITGNTEQAVLNAAEKLRDPNLNNAILFPEYMIVKEPSRFHSPPPFFAKKTLEQLGFDNQIATGIGENTINYPIDFANPKRIDSINMKVKYTAASFLDKNSYLSLKVNDIPVSGIQLYEISDKLKTWNIHISHDVLKPGVNNFSFVYTLHLPTEKCSPEEMNLAWGTIQKSSELQVNFLNKKSYFYLTNIKSLMLGDLMIAVPGDFADSFDLLQQLSNLVSDLNYIDNISLMLNTDLNATNGKAMNIILIGNYINSLNKPLPVYFYNKKIAIDIKLLPEVVVSDETPDSIIELVPSPFDSDKTLLMFSFLETPSLNAAFNILNDPDKLGLTNGNILLLYPNKTFTSLQSQKMYESTESKEQKIRGIAYFTWAIIGLFLLGIFILIYKKSHK